MTKPISVIVMILALSACDGPRQDGLVRIDGSSTAYPLLVAAAEDFQDARAGSARVTVAVTGTGGGFRRLCRGDVDITAASRPIRPDEAAACAAAGIDFVRLPVAVDALTVIVHPDNTWVRSLDLEQLRRLWRPQAQARLTHWHQLDPSWPARPVRLYGAGADSGSFGFFTSAVVGRTGASRTDFTASEDDNLVITGVAGDPGALGYVGRAWFQGNTGRVKAVPIRHGPAAPDGQHPALSRPLYVYLAIDASNRPEPRDFVAWLLEHARDLAEEAGYLPLSDSAYRQLRERFGQGRIGSPPLAATGAGTGDAGLIVATGTPGATR